MAKQTFGSNTFRSFSFASRTLAGQRSSQTTPVATSIWVLDSRGRKWTLNLRTRVWTLDPPI